MSHACEACIVTCVDFRLHGRADGANVIAEYARQLGVHGDLITRGGGIQDLVRPKLGCDESLLRDLTSSIQLHQVSQVHLVNHEDCGAYSDFDFASRHHELAQHRRDLRDARAILSRQFPAGAIHLALAELAPGTRDRFVIRPVT